VLEQHPQAFTGAIYMKQGESFTGLEERMKSAGTKFFLELLNASISKESP
jgi:hypothetical protein